MGYSDPCPRCHLEASDHIQYIQSEWVDRFNNKKSTEPIVHLWAHFYGLQVSELAQGMFEKYCSEDYSEDGPDWPKDCREYLGQVLMLEVAMFIVGLKMDGAQIFIDRVMEIWNLSEEDPDKAQELRSGLIEDIAPYLKEYARTFDQEGDAGDINTN